MTDKNLEWWGSDCAKCGNATPQSDRCDSCAETLWTVPLYYDKDEWMQTVRRAGIVEAARHKQAVAANQPGASRHPSTFRLDPDQLEQLLLDGFEPPWAGTDTVDPGPYL